MTTTFTAVQGAYAAFNFTGKPSTPGVRFIFSYSYSRQGATAFYFMGFASVPTEGTSGKIGILFDKDYYEVPENTTSQPQQVLFSRKRLDVNKEYYFRAMKLSTSGELHVHAMIYTVPDESSQGSGSGGIPVGAIVGGIAGGVCFAVLVMVLLRWLRHRRSRNQDDPLATATAPFLLPLYTNSTTIPLSSKQAVASRDSTATLPSLPRPSFASQPTHLATSTTSTSQPAHTNLTATGSMEATPPPYAG